MKYIDPNLKHMKKALKILFEDLQNCLNTLNINEYEKTCERIFKKIYDNLRSELSNKIEMITKLDLFDKENIVDDDNLSINSNSSVKNTNVLKPSQYTVIKSVYIDSLNDLDKSFGKYFVDTQLFLNYFEDIRVRK